VRLVEAPFSRRANFGGLLADRGVLEAVEIGTDRGGFARELLSRWNGMLWCVDPYASYPEMPWPRDADLAMAVAVLAPFVPRVRIVRATSRQFAETRGFGTMTDRIGFVYIDGAHDYAPVADDIAAWWPLLRPGAILAGHDLDPSGEHAPGVLRAVTEFAETNDLEVSIVRDHDAHSWFVVKP